MAKWYHIPTSLRMSDREYAANMNGMNIVFGAVLGFLLARAEGFSSSEFILVLVLSATCVTMIFYLESSAYKLFYFAVTAILIAALPWLMQRGGLPPIQHLQTTLAVWAGAVGFFVLTPRTTEQTEEETAKAEETEG